MIVDIPLSMFTGSGGKELIERLYALPDDTVTEKKDDYEIIQNLPTIEGYKPTRDHKPSTFIDEDLEPIFGDKQISFYDNYYLLYTKIKEYIYLKFEEDGFFKYCFQAGDDVVGCYELSDKDDIKQFIVHIVSSVPCTLFDIKENIGLN